MQDKNKTFLTNIHSGSKTKTKDELKILTQLLSEKGEAARWLDVPCSTGYYLGHFPEVERAGLDISEDMLNIASKKNPKIRLILGNFRNKSLVGKEEWNIISSMWYAYLFAESISEIEILIENIVYWLTDEGVCFMPVCDDRKNPYKNQVSASPIANDNTSTYVEKPLVTGMVWSWTEANSEGCDIPPPPIKYIVELFQKHFKTVEIIEYTKDFWGILASKKERNFDNIKSQFKRDTNE